MWGLTSTPPGIKFVVFNPPSGFAITVPLPVKPDPVRLERQPASPTCPVKSAHRPGVCYRMDTLLYILPWDDVRWRSSRLSSAKAVQSISKTGMATPPSMWPPKQGRFYRRNCWQYTEQTRAPKTPVGKLLLTMPGERLDSVTSLCLGLFTCVWFIVKSG